MKARLSEQPRGVVPHFGRISGTVRSLANARETRISTTTTNYTERMKDNAAMALVLLMGASKPVGLL